MIYKEINIKCRKYKAFGINLASDFIFEEMFESDGKPEIEIIYGKTPAFLHGETNGLRWFQAYKDHMLIHVDNIARFYVAEGKKITIEPFPNTSFDTVKLYLFGVAFAPLLFQRGIFSLHGSALNIEGKAIIISGDSGAGKSTLSLALRDKRYPLITDDVSVLENDDEEVLVHSSYRLQKISKMTAENFGIDVNTLEKIEGEEKYYLPVDDMIKSERIPVSAVFELVPSDKKEVRIEEIVGSNKLMTLINNTYHLQFIKYLEMSDEHFKFCSYLASKIKVFRIYRPKSGFTVDEQINLLMDAIK